MHTNLLDWETMPGCNWYVNMPRGVPVGDQVNGTPKEPFPALLPEDDWSGLVLPGNAICLFVCATRKSVMYESALFRYACQEHIHPLNRPSQPSIGSPGGTRNPER